MFFYSVLTNLFCLGMQVMKEIAFLADEPEKISDSWNILKKLISVMWKYFYDNFIFPHLWAERNLGPVHCGDASWQLPKKRMALCSSMLLCVALLPGHRPVSILLSIFDTLLFMHSENSIFPSCCREDQKETNENQHFVDW